MKFDFPRPGASEERTGGAPGALARLLAPDEPPAVGIENRDGGSPVLLVADHAGDRVPRALAGLGLARADLSRHIAVDLGILGVCRALSADLDAALIHQRYSRLVIDCNRHPQHPSAFAPVSDGVRVPGNENLRLDDAARRIVEIFMPYHAAIGSWLDRRRDAGRPAALVAMHSFTPHHGTLGDDRPWPVSVLFGRDAAIAGLLIERLRREGLNVGVNQPYVVDEENDFAVPVHGEARGVPSVEIEIRQDMIATPEDQARWGALLAPCVRAAVSETLGRHAPGNRP